MAQGQWVNIPGKGRRWQQPSGELMMQKPGLGFVQAQLSPVTSFLGGLFQAPGAFNTGRLQTRPAMPNLPADYKETELAAGAAAEVFRPGAGFPGQQAAAERDYQQKKSEIAQLTAQNPEFQRYENARKIAAMKGATPEQVQSAENIGMQMWAKANPELAKLVKPGQSGYEVIQQTLYPGGAPLPAMAPESIAMLNAIAPADATGIRPDITPMPGAMPVFSDASDDMYQAVMGIGGALPTPATQNPSPAAASPQQAGTLSFEDVSFQTPASQRRSDAFAQLLQGFRQYGVNP
jgi:hypothetical protein